MNTGYNEEKTNWLIESFENGFDIGCRGDENVRLTAPNLKFREIGNKTMLWNKVIKEVKVKRFAGQFKLEDIPFDSHIQSPIGLVPKDGGKDARLIFHLSYPRKTGNPLNANTPKHLCSVKYPDFNKAIQLCRKAGINCKMSKSDMKSAFHNLAIKKQHWRWTNVLLHRQVPAIWGSN